MRGVRGGRRVRGGSGEEDRIRGGGRRRGLKGCVVPKSPWRSTGMAGGVSRFSGCWRNFEVVRPYLPAARGREVRVRVSVVRAGVRTVGVIYSLRV